MSRSVLKLLFLVSGVLFVILSIFLILSVVLIFGTAGAVGGIGIIGGADAPTFGFFLHNVTRSPVFYAAMVSLLVCVGTGLALIFSKKPNK